MRNYIKLNGNNSNNITGLLIQELPPITKPKIRTQIEEINGRDGDIVTNLGYSAYNKEISIGLYGNYNVDDVIAYFNNNKTGEVIFSNEPDKFYNYEIFEQIDFNRLIRFKTATVKMHVQPFKYPTEEEQITESATVITGEGNELSLNNTKEGTPLEIGLKGNTYQETTTGKQLFDKNGAITAVAGTSLTALDTGVRATINTSYPQNVEVVTGNQNILVQNKNLFKMSSATPNSSTSYTINNNNSIRVYNTSATYRMAYVDLNVSAGNYVFTAQPVVTSGTWQIVIQKVVGGTATNFKTMSVTATTTFNLTENTLLRFIFYSTLATNTAGDVTYNNIQLEYGNTKTDFIEHQEQNYNINLGKNLFDKDNVIYQNNKILNDSGQETNDSSGGYTKMYIPVQPNTNYTISGMASSGSKRIYYFDSNKTFISRTSTFGSSYNTFTTPNNCYYVDFQYYISGNNFNTYQLEVGSQATTYSAYFTPIELCKIGTYQDYLYKSGENWYKKAYIGKVVLDGSENWYLALSGTNTNLYYTQVTQMSSDILSNYFTRNESLYAEDVEGIRGLPSNNRIWIRINKTTASDTTALKSWLSTHNTIVYYVLETPTEETITNAELIEQLEAILNAISYEDQTNISQENDNLGFIISASTSNMADITVMNIGNIYAKPLMTINGSGNIEVYLNGIQVLQIALGDNQDITIDVSKMEAYNSSTQVLLNRLVTGDYMKFLINSGNNTIGFRGSVTSVTIDNYTRWL